MRSRPVYAVQTAIVVIFSFIDYSELLHPLVVVDIILHSGILHVVFFFIVIKQVWERAYFEGFGVGAECDVVAIRTETGSSDWLAVNQHCLLCHVVDVVLCPWIYVRDELLRVVLCVDIPLLLWLLSEEMLLLLLGFILVVVDVVIVVMLLVVLHILNGGLLV